jgi:peptidoglycan hydrolase CwlO-like protein
MNFESALPLLIALVGSAGLWTYLSTRAKNAHERALEDHATRADFNDTLKEQVDRLAAKLDDKTEQIEKLLKEIAELRAELSAAQVTIRHLENLLRTR